MKSFYEGLQQSDAELIESLSRASYEVRESRKALLEQYSVSEEDVLLKRITAGVIPEHPAYEHYLSASILAQLHVAVRCELETILQQVKQA